MSLGERPGKIISNKVLLVEGKDEVNFFCAILSHLGIRDAEIFDVGGVEKFKFKFPAVIRIPGFRENVKTYAIIRDADADARSAFESVCDLLRKNKQPVPKERNSFTNGPPRVGVFIMPGSAEAGMLENLCIDTVAEHPIMPCVSGFMDCIEGHVKWESGEGVASGFPNNPHKAKAKAFLAGNRQDLPSVGVAAKAGVWNFNHECVRPLREFLSQLDADE